MSVRSGLVKISSPLGQGQSSILAGIARNRKVCNGRAGQRLGQRPSGRGLFAGTVCGRTALRNIPSALGLVEKAGPRSMVECGAG